MDIDEYLTSYPAPPAIARGVPKRQITVYLTEQEARLLGDLVHDPRFRDAYEGSVSTGMRHAFYYMMLELPNLPAGWTSTVQRLKQVFQTHNMQAIREMMTGELDEQAAYLNTLLDFSKKEAALAAWEDLCRKVATLTIQDDRKIATFLLLSHPEITRYRDRVEKAYGIEGTATLAYGLGLIED